MRLGAPVFGGIAGPDEWIAALKTRGYRAAYCPVDEKAGDSVVAAYQKAAAGAGIVIAEVGAWSNPISADEAIRREAMKLCRERLALADRIGARCCVNIAGSRNPANWDGPHAENYSKDTFDLIVESVRGIIDAVKPTRTFYTLEPMPWVPPDSADGYLELLSAIDRPRFAVHFDPVNIISSPDRFYRNGDLIGNFIAKLGPRIMSCHAKDIALSTKLTVHLDEVRHGLGGMDYRVYLKELSSLDPDLPLLVEHLEKEEDYRLAVDYIRGVAASISLTL
jgi:sugar phosphate isomerase/epimerase